MENLRYISAQQRLEIVKRYIKAYVNPDPNDDEDSQTFSTVEAFLFENPINRRLVDQAMAKADLEVDLERYSQFSEGWYSEIVRLLPSYLQFDEDSNDPGMMETKLSRKDLEYLATVMFLTTRGGAIKDTDIDQAKFVASKVFDRLDSKKG